LPDNFRYGKNYFITWLPDNSMVLLMYPGSYFNEWYPPELYSVADNHPSSNIVWLEQFPSLNDRNAEEGSKGGVWFPSIYGFSPDGRQIIVRKIIDGSTGEVILVDLGAMSLEDNFLNDLNLDEIRNAYLLP
jgi:hypothetical protein